MKKFLIGLVILLFSPINAYALEEVVLDIVDDLSILEVKEEVIPEIQEEQNTKPDFLTEPTLYEKFQNIKSREISEKTTSAYLLEEILTKEFETGIVKNAHFFGYFRGGLDMDIGEDDEDLTFNINSMNVGVNGKFRDGKTYYEARFRFNDQHKCSFLQYAPSNLYIANKSIPHHTITFGNTRTPTGYEGGLSMTALPFFLRSQAGRNFGNVRKVGIRVKGSYDLIDYDIGGYDSDTYFRSFFPGAEFASWVNLKPLGKTDGRYGKITLGGGLTAGHNNTNYCVTGVFAGYEYKKLFANFEYSSANGYNGASRISTKHAEGFNTTFGYKITPKLQILGRYDHYVPNKLIANDIRREYSAGINYFIKGQALKLMLNYVFCQNDLQKNSHRIILATQILL